MKRFLALSVVVLLSACSATVPINYIPSSSLRGQARVTVATFRYVPADLGSVAPNQFQKNSSSIGQKYTNEDVATIVRTALKKELAYSGFISEEPDALEVSGAVTRFYVDWVGFSQVTFEVGIDFEITKRGELLLKYSSASTQRAPKTESMSQQPEAVRAAISACIESFLSDARSKGIL